MQKIRKEFQLLKEQGWNPRLILEYVTKEGLRYFDGYISVPAKVQLDFYNLNKNLYVRVSDFSHFTLGTLQEIRNLNAYHYHSVPDTFPINPKTERVDVIYAQEMFNEAEYYNPDQASNAPLINMVLANFFRLVADPRHLARELSPKVTLEVDKDQINIKQDGDTIELGYRTALLYLYDTITELAKETKKEIVVGDKGYKYFKPHKVSKKEKAKGVPFIPTTFRTENRKIVLVDQKTKVNEVYFIDIHNEVLKGYVDTVKGLSDYLASMETILVADKLAGDVDYESGLNEVSKEGDYYKVADEVTHHKYVYPIKGKGVITFYYSYGYTDVASTICIDDIKDIVRWGENTPFVFSASPFYCKVNNILNLQPLYVHSIQYEYGILDINICCATTHIDGVIYYVTVPLNLLHQHFLHKYHKTGIEFHFYGGTLEIPYACYDLLDTSLTVEDIVPLHIAIAMKPLPLYTQTNVLGM